MANKPLFKQCMIQHIDAQNTPVCKKKTLNMWFDILNIKFKKKLNIFFFQISQKGHIGNKSASVEINQQVFSLGFGAKYAATHYLIHS